MSTKVLFRSLFIASLFGMGVLLMTETVRVRAQCENPPPSSCATCHEQQDPVNDKGEWHIIHASKDICINCHGGNGTVMDKDLAHDGLMAHPLDDIYTDCHSCHPDYDERASQFAQTLGVTPGSCATPTPVLIDNPFNEPPSHSVSVSTDIINKTSPLPLFAVIGAMLLILSFFFMGVGWLEKHHADK